MIKFGIAAPRGSGSVDEETAKDASAAHEEAFVRSFIVPQKRYRYLQLLASPKRRRQITDRLCHNLDFDGQWAWAVPAPQSIEQITRILRQLGAPSNCHVISASNEWDGREFSLEEALENLRISDVGTILCCLPGELAYYQSEDISGRYILHRARPQS